MKSVFVCKMCGECCVGKAGIVLAEKDLRRLAVHLGKSEDRVSCEYAEKDGGKLKILCNSDGACLFFEKGRGCSVHEAKPDVCRAWPFFRGNLVDEESFRMAREFCPGINPQATFKEFVAAGLDWLEQNELFAPNAPDRGCALISCRDEVSENSGQCRR